jgi:hypothetical protein
VLMSRGRQWFAAGETVAAVGPGTLPLFANLDVVNYMLACMQIAPARAAPGIKRSWTAIRAHLWAGGFDARLLEDEEEREGHLHGCVLHTVAELFKPHGICAGSEHQVCA